MNAGQKTITKKDLVDRISDTTNAKRVLVKRIVQSLLDQIVHELGEGNRLEFRDFGVFEVRERAPRLAQNPKTMAKVNVPRKRTVKFKVGRLMKDMLQQPPAARSQPIIASADRNGDQRPMAAASDAPAGHTLQS
jgi:integration host factor subunit beta